MVRAYDSAYPGSMVERLDGQYIDREDIQSLLEALSDAIKKRDQKIEDLAYELLTPPPEPK